MAYCQIGTNTWYIEFDFGDIPNNNMVTQVEKIEV